MLKIAIIPPIKNSEYLLEGILDGLLDLIDSGVAIEFRFLAGYPHPFGDEADVYALNTDAFLSYAKNADLIFLSYRFKETNTVLADRIGRYNHTVFIDGSEYKHNNRFDFRVQYDVISGTHTGPGALQNDMFRACGLYLRREKPYTAGIVPFPFGIERRYVRYTPDVKKDIDFVCIFGQDEYPLMRKYARELLVAFCEKNNFTYVVKKTEGFAYDDKKIAGRDTFYDTLARAKVGISIGGGGFDTLRFWETLANNCELITERIDIFPTESHALSYQRIHECNNLFDFQYFLETCGARIRESYNQNDRNEEYADILKTHSTKARVTAVLREAHVRGLIQTLPVGL